MLDEKVSLIGIPTWNVFTIMSIACCFIEDLLRHCSLFNATQSQTIFNLHLPTRKLQASE